MKKEYIKIIKETGHVIDFWLPLKIKYDKTPGLSMGIVYGGKLVYERSFGYADTKKKKKANKSTLYHIASISKTFTAVAIMQLVEEGKLHLDDKVIDYLPWFKGGEKNKNAKNITIRQILSHTAGLFRDGDSPHWETGNFPKDLKRSFGLSSLVFENATRFKYTNYGFSIMGLVIEKVSGMKYGDYITKKILKSLKMDTSAPDYLSTLSNVATGYGREIPDQKRKIFRHFKTNSYAPATGFLSNVVDLAKYLAALAFDGKEKLLNRESKKEIMRPHEKTGGDEEYGLGLGVFHIGKRKIIEHGGGFNGFITQILLDPMTGIGVIVLTNSLSSSASGIARGTLNAIFNGIDNPQKHHGKLPDYKKYEGIYRNSWGDDVIVRFGKDLLNFAPRTNFPVKFATILKKGKISDHFTMKTENVFDSPGEEAVFKNFRSQKAQTFLAGSMPAKRISIK